MHIEQLQGVPRPYPHAVDLTAVLQRKSAALTPMLVCCLGGWRYATDGVLTLRQPAPRSRDTLSRTQTSARSIRPGERPGERTAASRPINEQFAEKFLSRSTQAGDWCAMEPHNLPNEELCSRCAGSGNEQLTDSEKVLPQSLAHVLPGLCPACLGTGCESMLMGCGSQSVLLWYLKRISQLPNALVAFSEKDALLHIQYDGGHGYLRTFDRLARPLKKAAQGGSEIEISTDSAQTTARRTAAEKPVERTKSQVPRPAENQ